MASDKQMTIVEHLEELRRRIIISVVAILVITGIAFFFSDAILKFLLLPSGGLQLKAFGLMDGFMIKWHIALYTGVVVAFPVWAYQIFRFIYPGLLDQERHAIFPMLVGAMVLFVIGAVFGYYLLRGMIRVLIELYPEEVQFLPAADDYISFVLFFMLSSGLAFQLPIVLLLLIQFRIISTDLLRKQRRIAYFALFLFAEIITPVSDPLIAPLTVMIPLSVLYELSIWLGRGVERRRKTAEAEQMAAS
jgi:sec-independent protein translocase protein TatC